MKEVEVRFTKQDLSVLSLSDLCFNMLYLSSISSTHLLSIALPQSPDFFKPRYSSDVFEYPSTYLQPSNCEPDHSFLLVAF